MAPVGPSEFAGSCSSIRVGCNSYKSSFLFVWPRPVSTKTSDKTRFNESMSGKVKEAGDRRADDGLVEISHKLYHAWSHGGQNTAPAKVGAV